MKQKNTQLGIVVHAYNVSIKEAELEGLCVWSQHELQSEFKGSLAKKRKSHHHQQQQK
jgi:hypothetical protein